jgi:hypothetical protein
MTISQYAFPLTQAVHAPLTWAAWGRYSQASSTGTPRKAAFFGVFVKTAQHAGGFVPHT